MTVLNDRCSHILNTLLWSNDYIALPQLVEEMKVSRRSIYYDICRINEWLEENDIFAEFRGRFSTLKYIDQGWMENIPLYAVCNL